MEDNKVTIMYERYTNFSDEEIEHLTKNANNKKSYKNWLYKRREIFEKLNFFENEIDRIDVLLEDFKFKNLCNIEKFEYENCEIIIAIQMTIPDDLTFKDIKYIADYFKQDFVVSTDYGVFLYNGYYDD